MIKSSIIIEVESTTSGVSYSFSTNTKTYYGERDFDKFIKGIKTCIREPYDEKHLLHYDLSIETENGELTDSQRERIIKLIEEHNKQAEKAGFLR